MSGRRVTPSAPSGRRGPGRPRLDAVGTGQSTPQRVIEIAIELFSSRGFHATSVAELGERAGLAPGALYHHIGSKEELLWQILRTYTLQALDGAERIANGGGDPVDKLRALITFHVQTIARHRHEVLIQMRDGEALTGQRAVELQALRRQVQDCWQKVFDDGLGARRIRSADHVIVNAVLGMVNMAASWYRPDRGETPAAVAELICTTVLDGLVESG